MARVLAGAIKEKLRRRAPEMNMIRYVKKNTPPLYFVNKIRAIHN
jgi:hypothetical protein